MAQRWSWARCRRTLNYHLDALERQGFIRRIRRHRRTPTGIEMHSTLYVLLPKAFAGMRHMLRGAVKWSRTRHNKPIDAAREVLSPAPVPNRPPSRKP